MNVLRDVDIALRLARPTHGDMLARKLCDVAYGVYATPGYQAKFGPINSAGDLTGHQVVAFSEEERPLGPVWWLSRAEKNAKVVMRASSVATRLNAILGGEAVAALPCFIAHQQTALVQLVGPELVGNLELWLLTRADLARLGHVRTVMDFLIQQVGEQTPALAGRDM
jgi:DNA-binding transcriptional LysR family regulator